MLRLLAFLCTLSALGPAYAHAQDGPDRRGAQQIADSIEIAALARSLTRGAATDSARAARLYEWVARSLAYDVHGYLAGRIGDGTAESVYRKRVAVCGGYVVLLERLAREAGLRTMPIVGYAKGFDYRAGASTGRANHSWLAVATGGKWRLVDPTWGSGIVVRGRFEPRFTWDYFFINPDELILSHFPEEKQWQLLASPLRRREFERLPLVPRTLVDAGFDPSMIRATALADRVRTFPLVGTRTDVRILRAPLAGTLPRASRVNVELIWPGAADVALVSGGVWLHLTREGDRFRGEAVASASAVSLVGRSASSKEFETLLHYQVQ